MPLPNNASARCFDKLNMTERKSPVIPNILFTVVPDVLFSVIPSEAEESRGNEFFLLFPAAELFCFLGLPPRGLSSAVAM